MNIDQKYWTKCVQHLSVTGCCQRCGSCMNIHSVTSQIYPDLLASGHCCAYRCQLTPNIPPELFHKWLPQFSELCNLGEIVEAYRLNVGVGE